MNPNDTSGRDPFGRLSVGDADQDALRAITDLANLTGPVGRDAGNKPEDVARIEMLLENAGEMDLGPSEGPTGYVGQRLLDALTAFQRRKGLPETGVVRPGDATHRALAAHADETTSTPDDGEPGPAYAAAPGPSAI
ncbi:MAG: peptidoglycan-binding domain-containing protein [Rhodospirillales bacterium]